MDGFNVSSHCSIKVMKSASLILLGYIRYRAGVSLVNYSAVISSIRVDISVSRDNGPDFLTELSVEDSANRLFG